MKRNYKTPSEIWIISKEKLFIKFVKDIIFQENMLKNYPMIWVTLPLPKRKILLFLSSLQDNCSKNIWKNNLCNKPNKVNKWTCLVWCLIWCQEWCKEYLKWVWECLICSKIWCNKEWCNNKWWTQWWIELQAFKVHNKLDSQIPNSNKKNNNLMMMKDNKIKTKIIIEMLMILWAEIDTLLMVELLASTNLWWIPRCNNNLWWCNKEWEDKCSNNQAWCNSNKNSLNNRNHNNHYLNRKKKKKPFKISLKKLIKNKRKLSFWIQLEKLKTIKNH